MNRDQLQGGTYGRDGQPLEGSGANWLFNFQDVGSDGYVKPSVFSTHNERSQEVQRSVVPHQLIHPGLALGTDAPYGPSTLMRGMNTLTSDFILPSHTLHPNLYSNPMDPPRVPSNFFIASSLPGAPYYGQTGNIPYDQAQQRQRSMTSSNTIPEIDRMKGDGTSEFGPYLPTRDSHRPQIPAHHHAEDIQHSQIDPHLQDRRVQDHHHQDHRLQDPRPHTEVQESFVRSDLREQAHEPHNAAASLSSGVVSMPHHMRNKD